MEINFCPSPKNVFIHGFGITAASIARALGQDKEFGLEPVIVCSGSETKTEFDSQHAQCIVHRGFLHSRHPAHPHLIKEMFDASCAWDHLIRDLKIPHQRGMLWMFPQTNDRLHFNKISQALNSCREMLDQPDRLLLDMHSVLQPTTDFPLTVQESLKHVRNDSCDTYWIDQVVMQPADALTALLRGMTVVKQRTGDTTTNSIYAWGKEHFFKQVRNRRLLNRVVLQAKGDLPIVNAIFEMCIGGSAKVVLVSHKLEDGKSIWLMDSDSFTEDMKLAQILPSIEVGLSLFLHGTALQRFRAAEKGFYQGTLTKARSGNLRERCIHLDTESSNIVAFSELFTFAPEVGKSVAKEFFAKLSSPNSGNPPDGKFLDKGEISYRNTWETLSGILK